MIKNIDRKHAHLTLDNRIDIQQMLRDSFNFKMIANSLKKDPSTISKEVRKHIFVKESTCTVKDKHGKEIKEICIKLTKPPYVCNACKKRTYCHMEKHLYDGKYAQNEYEKLLKESREGIPLTKESFYEVDKIISEGVRKGQHIYHIVQTNDINVSLSTVYRHLDKGYLSISPLDLPRKVKFKPRNKNNVTYVPNRVRVGRTYDDFLKFIKIHDISNWVEMDTVIGSQGGKVIMTWDFTFCNFMVGFLLDSKTASNVASAFFDIKFTFCMLIRMAMGTPGLICQRLYCSIIFFSPSLYLLSTCIISSCCFGVIIIFYRIFNNFPAKSHSLSLSFLFLLLY